jgi:hypothetical protein
VIEGIHLTQNSNIKFLLYPKPKWHNKASRELALVKVFHTIQLNWFFWLTVTGMRLISVYVFSSGKALYPFETLPYLNSAFS